MRTFTILFSALLLGTAVKAQTTATFDDLSLSKADTSYVSLADSGFNDGLAHFPYAYDPSYINGWASGFSYSNWTDSVTSGSANQYSAKTAKGYAGSDNYAVVYCNNPVTYASNVNLNLTGAAIGHKVNGFFVTNSTYAYNSMKYGDDFDTMFHHGDWFLLTVKGYTAGSLTTDSVNFYLADFRFSDSSMDYIVDTWQWVNLLPLGNIDSIQFSLTASDTSFGFINVPTYFCIDNFTTNETSEGVAQVAHTALAKVYPNPAANMLYVDLNDNSIQQIAIIDMAGNVINTYQVSSTHNGINTASLPAGTYMLQLSGNGKIADTRFVKQ